MITGTNIEGIKSMWPHVCTQQHTCNTQHVQWDKTEIRCETCE